MWSQITRSALKFAVSMRQTSCSWEESQGAQCLSAFHDLLPIVSKQKTAELSKGKKKIIKIKVIPSIVICSQFCTLPATSWVEASYRDVWGLNGACSLHLQIQCPSSQDQQKCRQIYWATASGTTLYHGFPSVYGLLFLTTQMISECGFLQFWKCKFILYFQSRVLLLSVLYSYQNKY